MIIDGVEIAENRYLKSLELIEKMEIFNKVFVYNTDFRNIHLSNYDIIICSNLVFSKKDNIDLYHKILDEFIGYCIFNTYDYNLKKFLFKTEYVRTSWNKKQLVYIFLIR